MDGSSKGMELPLTQQQQQQDTMSLRQACHHVIHSPEWWSRPDDKKETNFEQWRLHRSQWRYVNALVPYFGPPTFTLRRVWVPFLVVMLLCIIIKVVEGRISWTLDRNNYSFKIYSSSSFMLSLLIAFRLNRTYERWWLARQSFSGICNGLVNTARQTAIFSDDDTLSQQWEKWSLCLVYGMSQLVEDQPAKGDPRIQQLLDKDEWQLYCNTSDVSNLSLNMLAALTNNSGFLVNREIMLHTWLLQVATNVHQVQNIKLQAAPFGVSLFCTGWIYIWLLLLPFGIFPEGSWWAFVPVSVMVMMMLGLEDLAVQLEDPFQSFPHRELVEGMAKKLHTAATEARACRQHVVELKERKSAEAGAADSASAAADAADSTNAAAGAADCTMNVK